MDCLVTSIVKLLSEHFSLNIKIIDYPKLYYTPENKFCQSVFFLFFKITTDFEYGKIPIPACNLNSKMVK